MSRLRVLICRVDEDDDEQMTELARVDLPAVPGQWGNALDRLEAQVATAGQRLLGRLCELQWEEVDAQAVARYCAGTAPGSVWGDGSAVLTAAVARVAQGVGHLLYLDECDLHLLPVLRAMWMKGPRVRVPTPGTNAKRAFFSALDAVSGRFHTADHARKLAVNFVACLRQLAQAYPTGPLYLAMDNVTMHDAKVVRTWLAAHPRVQVLWLPKYAAHEENPAERLWGLMKDDVAANRLAATIDELAEAARRFFRDVAPHPVALPSPTTAAQNLPLSRAHAAPAPPTSLAVAA